MNKWYILSIYVDPLNKQMLQKVLLFDVAIAVEKPSTSSTVARWGRLNPRCNELR